MGAVIAEIIRTNMTSTIGSHDVTDRCVVIAEVDHMRYFLHRNNDAPRQNFESIGGCGDAVAAIDLGSNSCVFLVLKVRRSML